ncbi:hypothetical protein H310_08728 [Aphanomyces invadans]|uniref:Uncharacterized protein n=1 Tax=Aphanomyces invadans TaxID=157072 RepID=A0A024TWR2_9STRA|nr:hypothetical protein H310_08728 [Aphanomyces invadans]ETV98610.1 hypothetical protein H310_08728 [Aphanomyces invadans]|eukprot:XP_008872807.1 hypothetical protein H310_08728 [Aphanomyces invadans]
MEDDTEVDVQSAYRRKTALGFKGCTDVELLKEVIHVIKKQAFKDDKAKQIERRESNGEKICEAAMATMKRKMNDDADDATPNKKQEMVAKANEVKAGEVRVQHENNLLAQQRLELKEKRYELDKAEQFI